MEEVENASIELLSQYKSRIEERNRSADDHFNSMQKTLIGIAKDHVKGRRSTTSSGRYFSQAPVTKRNENDDLKVWSVQALEDSQRTRKENFISSISEPTGGTNLERISLDAGEEEEDDEPLFHPSFQFLSTEVILSQKNGGNLPGSLETLLPHPIPLRPRKSRRCRAEIAESRPGILVKPKLNPLEGDSSLRTGHGQWWKKVCYCYKLIFRRRKKSREFCFQFLFNSMIIVYL